jgi:hypothetical protein
MHQIYYIYLYITVNNKQLLPAGEYYLFIACWRGKYENLFTQEYHFLWGQRSREIWYSGVNKLSYFLNLHAINVLLYRMKPRKHIHVTYCWQTYFKPHPQHCNGRLQKAMCSVCLTMGKNQNTWSHRTKIIFPPSEALQVFPPEFSFFDRKTSEAHRTHHFELKSILQMRVTS